jgi:surface protein
MSYMFYMSEFNGDISKWNVSNIENMSHMFEFNYKFQGDISKWKVSNVTNMESMFASSGFNGDIS